MTPVRTPLVVATIAIALGLAMAAVAWRARSSRVAPPAPSDPGLACPRGSGPSAGRPTGAALEGAFGQVADGTSTGSLCALLGPPNAIVGEKWHYAEVRPPAVGENLPVYVLTVRDGRVVKKESFPGVDAIGPGPLPSKTKGPRR